MPKAFAVLQELTHETCIEFVEWSTKVNDFYGGVYEGTKDHAIAQVINSGMQMVVALENAIEYKDRNVGELGRVIEETQAQFSEVSDYNRKLENTLQSTTRFFVEAKKDAETYVKFTEDFEKFIITLHSKLQSLQALVDSKNKKELDALVDYALDFITYYDTTVRMQILRSMREKNKES